MERYERWAAQHPNDDTTQPSPGSSNTHTGNVNPKHGEASRRQDDSYARAQDERDRGRQAETTRRDEQNRHEEQRRTDALNEEARRKAQEEIDRRRREEMDRRQREDIDRRRRETARREEEQRQRGANDPDSRRKEEVVANARRAAGVAQHESIYHGAPQNDPSGPSSAIKLDAQRRQQEFELQQAEMKRREEEIIRAKRQGDIARRQEEADDAARAARQNLAQTPSHLIAPRSMGPSRIPSFADSQLGVDVPLPMPLESPTRHDDDYSTDHESVTDDQAPWHRDRNPLAGTPKTPVRGYVVAFSRVLDPSAVIDMIYAFRRSYPPPVTTTSPAPGSGPVRYPSLMSQHQLKQGYAPSLQSMFINPGSSRGPASLLFVPENSSSSSSSSLYPSNALPRPSQPSQYPYGPPAPQHQHNTSISPYPGYGPSRNASAIPPSVPPPPTGPPRPDDISRISRPANATARADPVVGELKNVSVPRDCLPKFLSIAALNTSRNRETCGLLLGKDKGHKFTVTTLLIPKQHSTSDTCTMDEEELVMMFTEERSLITLGWVSSAIVYAT